MIRQLHVAVARGNNPGTRFLRSCYRGMAAFSLPAPRFVVIPILRFYLIARGIYFFVKRVLFCEPAFKGYCKRYGRGVRTGVFLHWIQGAGAIVVGDRVVMDGKSSILFTSNYVDEPMLFIGDGTFVGHNTTFVVGDSITVGRNCLISTDVCLRDYDGHPVDPIDRALGRPAPACDVRPIAVGNNVWIGARAIVLKGVTIGDNSVVAAAAVVTKDVPDNCVVAGNPARIVRFLTAETPRVSAETDNVDRAIDVEVAK